MAGRPAPGQARQRVLEVAGALFSARGYNGVTLRDIAAALQVRQPALYYHAPGGKAELYALVTRQHLQTQRDGLCAAIDGAPPNITDQLRAVASHLIGQPPFDLSRFLRADLPALDPAVAEALQALMQDALIRPISDAITAAYRRGEVRMVDATIMAHVFLSGIHALHAIQSTLPVPIHIAAQDVTESLLVGLRR